MGKYLFNIKYKNVEVHASSRDSAELLAFEQVESGELDADFDTFCGNCKEELDICCCDNCCCEADDVNVSGDEQNS